MDNIVDFQAFKTKKENHQVEPFFKNPTVLTLGDPEDETKQVRYMVIANGVHEGRQYLALDRMDKDENTIALVEAIIKDQQLDGIQPIDEERYEEIKELFINVFMDEEAELKELLESDHDDD